MAMDPSLLAMMTQVINVRSPTANSTGGSETLAVAVPRLAHVEILKGTGAAPGGTELKLAPRTLIVVEQPISIDDRVWLPGDSPANLSLGKKPSSVFAVPDEFGVIDHYEVTL